MSKYRTQQHWPKLITEGRQSGMTDMDWCRANGISRSTFYKAVKRLRDSACELHEPKIVSNSCLDLTATCTQDIVPIRILPDEQPQMPDVPSTSHISYAMEINAGSMTIKISNDISPGMLSQTLRILGGLL